MCNEVRLPATVLQNVVIPFIQSCIVSDKVASLLLPLFQLLRISTHEKNIRDIVLFSTGHMSV